MEGLNEYDFINQPYEEPMIADPSSPAEVHDAIEAQLMSLSEHIGTIVADINSQVPHSQQMAQLRGTRAMLLAMEMIRLEIRQLRLALIPPPAD